jgi:hypothetical protein
LSRGGSEEEVCEEGEGVEVMEEEEGKTEEEGINILTHHAAAGLSYSPTSPSHSSHRTSSLSFLRSINDVGLRSFLSDTFRLAVSKVVLFPVDVGLSRTRVTSWCAERMGRKGEGLEDLLQRQVTVRFSLSSRLFFLFQRADES